MQAAARDVDVVVGLADVDEQRHSARLHHGFDCRDEGVRGDDDSVARTEAGGEQAEAERVEATRHSHAFTDAAVLRELELELVHGRAVREGAAVDEVGDLREHAALQRRRSWVPGR